MKEQANNRSNNHLITFNGATMNTKQWSEKLGIKYTTIHSRIRRGWSIQRVLSPVLMCLMLCVCLFGSPSIAYAGKFGDPINKYKYSVDRYNKYGIFCGYEDNFLTYFGNRRWIALGSCYDSLANGPKHLYRTPEQEEIAQRNQAYLNGEVVKELTNEEKAIALLESLGWTVTK